MNVSNIYNLDLLHNEQKINELLKDIDLIEPPKNFLKFLINKINGNNNEVFEKYKKYSNSEQKKLIDEYESINYEFEKNKILIKLYIFKGCENRTNYKPSELELFKDIFLINLYIDKKIGFCKIDENLIKLKFNEDKIFKQKIKSVKLDNDLILDISYKFKTDDNFKYFVLKIFFDMKKKHKSFPNFNELLNKWNNLSDIEKKDYLLLKPSLKNEYIYQDIYDLIHANEPIPPKYPIELYFEEKKIQNLNHEKVNEFYDKISNDEKKNYYLLYNRRYLAYKYKLLLYKKFNNKYKIKKPRSPIQMFIKEYNLNIPKYINNIEFFNNEFKKLDFKTKEYYYKKYTEELKNYNNTLKYLENIETNLPTKPYSPFSTYFLFKSKNINDLKTYKYFNILSIFAEQWRNEEYKIKNYYKENFINQIKIYNIRIQDYENFGYYDKNTYSNVFINNYDTYVKKEIIAAFTDKHRIQKITKSIDDFRDFFKKHNYINIDK